ncbi:hypothetical protein [Paractinoplanes durhamensis]|uniref:hypothetical protein n=1 Tax=Paractinoplanes durhamensis TaxID=113563 RepID=UPI0031DE5331
MESLSDAELAGQPAAYWTGMHDLSSAGENRAEVLQDLEGEARRARRRSPILPRAQWCAEQRIEARGGAQSSAYW